MSLSLSARGVIIEKVIKSDGTVQQELIDLLGYTNPEITLPDNKLETIIAPTQKNWIRQGQNRWEQADLAEQKELGAKIEIVLSTLGLKEPIVPQRTGHNFATVFGGTVEAMTLRVAYLREMINAGAFSGKVLLFGSTSDCSPYLKGLKTLIETHPEWFAMNSKLPENLNETGVLSFLAENFIKPFGVTYEVIDMPDVAMPEQKTRKANTNDQALKLKECIQAGSVLFISNDDLGVRQGVVLETNIPKDTLDLAIFRDDFGTEIRTTFQSAGSATFSPTLGLDNLARLLYQVHSSTK